MAGRWKRRSRAGSPSTTPDLAVTVALDGVGVLYNVLGYVPQEIEAGRLVPLPLQAFIEFLRENLQAP
jgi:hypothetical protein